MYIAMNRFRIVKGEESEFERIWAERDTHLATVPGFVEFNLLRGAEQEDHTLFISHTIWDNEGNFTDWTNSDAFRKAHAKAGAASKKSVYMGRPQFEGFTSVQTVRR